MSNNNEDNTHDVFFENDNADDGTQAPKPASALKSNLDLVNDCDNFPYYTTNPTAYTAYTTTHYHLLIPDHIQSLGLVPPAVASIFRNLPSWELDESLHTLTLTAGTDRATRTAAVAQTTAAMRATAHFAVLDNWRNELYPVFGENGDVLFDVERAASPLLGIATYGCHMTAFTRTWVGTQEALRLWVPRRARAKQTYGGMLDNSVAGGLSSGEPPIECLVREADEEASLDAAMVRRDARAVGTVSYFHIRDARAGGETGLLQPECQFVYDLEVGDDVVLRPNDGEVEGFELLGTDEVKERLARGEFKPNCALVLLDFFMRHGILTPENERHYAEIVSRMHRLLEFPLARF